MKVRLRAWPQRAEHTSTATAAAANRACLPGGEQAIEIARQEVSVQPENVEAVLSESKGRPVWQVTCRGRLSPPCQDS